MVILQFSNEGHVRSTLYLGVKIHWNRSKRLLTLAQEQYIQRVLERFRMKNCILIDTPMAKDENLSNNLCPKTQE